MIRPDRQIGLVCYKLKTVHSCLVSPAGAAGDGMQINQRGENVFVCEVLTGECEWRRERYVLLIGRSVGIGTGIGLRDQSLSNASIELHAPTLLVGASR